MSKMSNAGWKVFWPRKERMLFPAFITCGDGMRHCLAHRAEHTFHKDSDENKTKTIKVCPKQW